MALQLVTPAASLAEVVAAVARRSGQQPELLATGASLAGCTLSHLEARERIRQGGQFLMLFGTGWGLSTEVLDMVDHRLAPIYGATDYNHLSVRSAAAVMLDRLLGRSYEG